MENRHGLFVNFYVCAVEADHLDSKVSVGQIQQLRERGFRPKTVEAVKSYHTHQFVESLREMGEAYAALAKKCDPRSIVINVAHAVSQRTR